MHRKGYPRTEGQCRSRYQRLNGTAYNGQPKPKNRCSACGQIKRGHTCSNPSAELGKRKRAALDEHSTSSASNMLTVRIVLAGVAPPQGAPQLEVVATSNLELERPEPLHLPSPMPRDLSDDSLTNQDVFADVDTAIGKSMLPLVVTPERTTLKVVESFATLQRSLGNATLPPPLVGLLGEPGVPRPHGMTAPGSLFAPIALPLPAPSEGSRRWLEQSQPPVAPLVQASASNDCTLNIELTAALAEQGPMDDITDVGAELEYLKGWLEEESMAVPAAISPLSLPSHPAPRAAETHAHFDLGSSRNTIPLPPPSAASGTSPGAVLTTGEDDESNESLGDEHEVDSDCSGFSLAPGRVPGGRDGEPGPPTLAGAKDKWHTLSEDDGPFDASVPVSPTPPFSHIGARLFTLDV